MKDNQSYSGAFSSGTAKKESVRKRFSVFNEILINSINGIKISRDDNKVKHKKFQVAQRHRYQIG